MFSKTILRVQFRTLHTAAVIAHRSGQGDLSQKLAIKAIDVTVRQIEKDI